MKVYYFVLLTRPLNVLITVITVFLAGLLANCLLEKFAFFLIGAISAGFTAAAGNVINDIFDTDTDKINKPEGILVNNKISKTSASVYYFILVLLSVILSYYLGEKQFLIVILANLLLFNYSFKLKRTILFANVSVALLTALVLFFGATIGNSVSKVIFPMIFAFLANLSREIIKDIIDIKGDERANILTFPIKYGVETALNIAKIIIVILIVSTIIPFLINYYGIEYFILIVFISDILFIYILHLLSKKQFKLVSDLIKVNMFLGILIIAITINI